MRRIYHCSLGGAAVALGVAAAVGVLAGLVSVLGFLVLGVASGQSMPGTPRARRA